MSEIEYEGPADAGYEAEGDFGGEGYGYEPAELESAEQPFDPWPEPSPSFAEAALAEAEAPPEPPVHYPEPEPQFSAEELARAEKEVTEHLAALHKQFGSFDHGEALAEASAAFEELVARGIEPSDKALEAALGYGAEMAAATERGRPLVERLIEVELERVGPNADKQAIWDKADGYIDEIVAAGVEPHEAAQRAVTFAASEVSGVDHWRGMNPNQRAQSVARYYASKTHAERALEHVQAKPASVPEAKLHPGHPGYVAALAAKWGGR